MARPKLSLLIFIFEIWYPPQFHFYILTASRLALLTHLAVVGVPLRAYLIKDLLCHRLKNEGEARMAVLPSPSSATG